MLVIRRTAAEPQRPEQDELVDRVRGRVRRLGQHRRRSGHRPGGELRDRKDGIGREGDQDRRTALMHSAVSSRAAAGFLPANGRLRTLDRSVRRFARPRRGYRRDMAQENIPQTHATRPLLLRVVRAAGA